MTTDAGGHSKLQAINERDFLRVGYIRNNFPFGFFNATDDLVGFDVEMAHILAKDLGVTLEFVPVTHDNIATQLDSNYCDIIMAGTVTTIYRATKVTFSNAYLNDIIAFIVKDYRRHEFTSSEYRAKLSLIKIADYVQIPVYSNINYKYFPHAEIEPINTWISLKKKDRTIDALYDYWILGKNATPVKPRWSVVRDVLH